MRRSLCLISVAAVFTVTGAHLHASACEFASCQSDGASNLPAAFSISLPFKNAENVLVASGYGPTGGSSLHCRASDSLCANDYYGLDLELPDHPNNGKGQPMVAVALGTVLDAGWGQGGWANYGQRVYIKHDFNDGHSYVTLYAHLDSIAVNTGQHVAMGDQLGTLGQSCQNAPSCSSFSSPHLHWAMHRDSSYSSGSYGGNAVKPEPLDGYTGLTQGQQLVSKNGGGNPPPTCDVQIGASEVILEEDGPCAQLVGSPLADATGHGGHAYSAQQTIPVWG